MGAAHGCSVGVRVWSLGLGGTGRSWDAGLSHHRAFFFPSAAPGPASVMSASASLSDRTLASAKAQAPATAAGPRPRLEGAIAGEHWGHSEVGLRGKELPGDPWLYRPHAPCNPNALFQSLKGLDGKMAPVPSVGS